ncbi:MAG: DUF1566 domain-containing protein [Nitrospirae bacterium]|nr:DUF1566 domain-containing protein [Nitrospirota bacterium]
MSTNKNQFCSILLFIVVVGVVVFPCLCGVVYAGTVSLPKTGQTTSYAAGDDGELQVGVAWPYPRFKDNGDQTVGLIWTKDAGTPTVGRCTGGTITWQGALDYVACLNAANYLGHNDWRLPNINELESLVNAGHYATASWLNSQGFVNVQSYKYWSSTTYAVNTSDAWYIVIRIGELHTYDKNLANHFAWPVRSGQTGAVANSPVCSTGQKTSYAAGDDGALQKGVAWPNQRFKNNSNGTVTDNLTGLMWTKDASVPRAVSCTGDVKNWQGALEYVKCLNTGSYLGYSDWRLPNRKEMLSLIDRERHAPVLSSGHPFENTQSNSYWSSTTDANTTSDTFAIDMNIGDIYSASRSYDLYGLAGTFHTGR